MVTVAQFVDLLVLQSGARYRFGAEVAEDDPNPPAFDCSEVIEWAAGRLGVAPRMPDGSWYQARHVRNAGLIRPVSEMLRTRGALLFRFGGDPFAGGRPPGAHVAVSLGDGRTFEARSTSMGVGVFGNAFARSWTHAGLVPGLDYSGALPGTAPADPERWPTLRRGDRGPMVARAQGLLMAAGHGPGGLVFKRGAFAGLPDGDYGPRTEAEVRRFQTADRIGVDGVTGGETWRRLVFG